MDGDELQLPDLADVSLRDLLSGQDTAVVLDEVLRRLLEHDDRDTLTISAFGSAL